MRSLAFAFLVSGLLIACNPSPQVDWAFQKLMPLGQISPLSLVVENDHLLISDVDRDQIVRISPEGEVVERIRGFRRPMHICYFRNQLIVPEAGASVISIVDRGEKRTMPVRGQLQTPAAISFNERGYAIADSELHRIFLYIDEEERHFGQLGAGEGEFNTPTDVQLTENEVFVADALNARVQVFSLDGKFKRIIGSPSEIGRASGIGVSDKVVVVADFERNQILTYSHSGQLLSVRTELLRGPSDVHLQEDMAYVSNYADNSVAIFKKR